MINCLIKYNVYLLYRSRPKDLTKNYSIEIHAYNKIDLSYYSSWRLSVKFVFLPVNRIDGYLIIPSAPMINFNECPLICGDHGHCSLYRNSREYYCRCDSSWFGLNCSKREDDCDCSMESICVGKVNNRSICLCSINRSGRRCSIPSICQMNPCANEGECVAKDDRVSLRHFICICKDGYSGEICQLKDTSIEISFRDRPIPQSLRIDFVTVKKRDDPLMTTVVKKIGFDQDSITVYRSILFHLIFVEIENEYYLVYLQMNASRFD